MAEFGDTLSAGGDMGSSLGEVAGAFPRVATLVICLSSEADVEGGRAVLAGAGIGFPGSEFCLCCSVLLLDLEPGLDPGASSGPLERPSPFRVGLLLWTL